LRFILNRRSFRRSDTPVFVRQSDAAVKTMDVLCNHP
jgi:hypothetical protein